MSAFWLWFIRPIAETLGAVALVVLLYGCYLTYFKIQDWKRK